MYMFKKLAWFFKQERKAYIIGIIMLVFVAILTGIVPLVIANVIDQMSSGQLTFSQVIYYAILIIIITILQYGLRYVWRMNIHGTAAKLEMILRQRIFNHLTQMDSQFFHHYRTGDLMARATNDMNEIQRVAGAGILTLVDSLSQGLITLFMMFIVIDWRLSVVALLPIPLIAIMISFLGNKVHHYSSLSQQAFSFMNDKVQESVTGMKVIKSFGEEALDSKDFQQHTHDVVEQNRMVYIYDAGFRPVSQLIMGISTVIGLFYGGLLVSRGEVTIGLLVAFLNYVTRMNWPMIAIGSLFNILERGSASYDRVEELLNEKSHIIESANPVIQPIQGDLDILIDSFTYEDEIEPTLQDIHIHVKEGETLGIVGKTGSGKTTLFKLLMRSYDHYSGSIQFNHISIKDYSLDALLGHIGYVPQEHFLFSTSIRENIRFANPKASQAEVERVAKLANIHDDILALPNGYDTLVGERGVALSGGQQQRISIARAILTYPEVLILDDSLSAVDAKTEEAILSAIKMNRKGKTTLIAAHRLSSVMHAEEIIVLDEGQIIERGTHHELVELNGWYAEMYQRQQLEEEIEGGDHSDGRK